MQLSFLDVPPVNIGRLFKLKLKWNAEARAAALHGIRELPNGWWQARVGGRLKGHTVTYPSRAKAEAAVNEYYGTTMHAAVTAHQMRRSQCG